MLPKPRKTKLPVAKPPRLPTRNAMTIIAGFHCIDGIVICADTLEGLGDYLKGDKAKIEVRPYWPSWEMDRRCCAIFAGAGNGDFIDYLVDKLWSAMEGESTIDGMVKAAENELISQYQKFVPIYPSGMPEAEFLIGLWAKVEETEGVPLPPGEALEIVRIRGPIINRGISLDAIGFGWVIAKYIASRLLWPKTSFDMAIPIALYMIDEAKEHVRECGGDTNVVTVDNYGKVVVYSQDEIRQRTKHFREVDYWARQIVGLALNENLSDEQYRALLKNDLERVDKIRKSRITPSASQKSEPTP